MDRGRDIHPDDNKLINKQVINNSYITPNPDPYFVIHIKGDFINGDGRYRGLFCLKEKEKKKKKKGEVT